MLEDRSANYSLGSSFTERKGAAANLPHFQLPHPEIPSTKYPNHISPNGVSAGLRAPALPAIASPSPSQSTSQPLRTSAGTSYLTPSPGITSDGTSPSPGVNTGSSQSSHHVYYSGHTTGSWPTPGGSHQSGYTYTNGGSAQNPSPLAQPTYQRPSAYNQVSPSVPQFATRPAPSPGSSEGLQSSSSYAEQSPYAAPSTAGANGGGGTATAHNPAVTQPPTPGQSVLSGSSNTQEGASYRGQQAYFPTSSTPQTHSYPAFPSGHASQPSPTAPSPSTTGPHVPRGLTTLTSGMAPPPMAYQNRTTTMPQPMTTYPQYPAMHGPVLSNMHQPGAPLSMVGALHGMPHQYPHIGHHGIYNMAHHSSTQQAERPFKCDTCPQSFNRNHDLKRHKRIHLAVKPFPCGSCEKSFSRKDALKVRNTCLIGEAN